MPASTPVELFGRILADRSRHFEKLREEVREGKRTIVLQSLPGSALAFAISELVKAERRPVLLLTAGGERAEDLTGDFEFLGISHPLHYPKWEVLPYDEEELSLEIMAKHLDVYETLARRRKTGGGEPFVICAPVDATMHRILPREELEKLTVHIEWGDRLDVAALADQLNAAGYSREPLVEARGEYSVRGGIIDIFPLNAENPIRIDLFGDEIESIRVFDVSTQRSLEELGTEGSLVIPPAAIKSHINEYIQESGKLQTIFDLLPEDTLIVLETPERFNEVCEYFQSAVERQFEAHKGKDTPRPDELLIPAAELPAFIDRFRRIEHSSASQEVARSSVRVAFEFEEYSGETSELGSWLSQIRKLQSKDYTVAVICDNDGQVQRFDEVLREQEISALPILDEKSASKLADPDVLTGYQDVILMVGALQTGFSFPDCRLCLITDREIFGRYKRRYVYKKIYKGKPIQTSSDIRRGDFVVHIDHGIGKFLGMRVQEIDGRMVDLIEILYANEDKLLVPVDKIHKVQKYSGPEQAEPALDKLGSSRWVKRRKKHSEEIEKLAEALLELYAERHMAKRPSHKVDTIQQREFEASFLYQETPDQMEAINSVKKDMEGERPMDRLVCGDVGYGKTEVAIRAVFKCIQSGRQAAVLCPTTILAQQHFKNFSERFADYPLRMDMMSRFKKPQEIKEIKKKLKAGELDVVIGTHALLAKDVQFQDLGLIVVDEEQRFGVKHKEKLKELRTELDILTLSATPIPRTLHFALSGLRDLSLITTPPPDRQPIKTRIIQFEEEQVAEAILRELNRGGQVYFIHNRVQSIQEVAKRLHQIVPHAKIAVAHGQMKDSELEETMLKFIDHQFDILCATTIIENGVDIPNCNTIIINRADAFGLAQLYQLRGRVGREKRRAYAYLIVPQGRAITESAVKRLQAIEEFAELGAGFSIAMRDLEIRGAGDILGKAQHGAITEIGFELFCELLSEKVQEKQGDIGPRFHEVDIRCEASAYIPGPYMPIEAQRVTFYKRFAGARSEQELVDIEEELQDRYGDLPEPAQSLLETFRIRMACQPLKIGAVRQSKNKTRLTFIHPIARDIVETIREAAGGDKDISNIVADSQDQILITTKEGIAAKDLLPILTRLFKKSAEFISNGNAVKS